MCWHPRPHIPRRWDSDGLSAPTAGRRWPQLRAPGEAAMLSSLVIPGNGLFSEAVLHGHTHILVCDSQAGVLVTARHLSWPDRAKWTAVMSLVPKILPRRRIRGRAPPADLQHHGCTPHTPNCPSRAWGRSPGPEGHRQVLTQPRAFSHCAYQVVVQQACRYTTGSGKGRSESQAHALPIALLCM